MIRCPSASRLPVRRKIRNTGPAPVVDRTFQRDEGLGVRLRIDAFLGPVSGVLPAHYIGRPDGQHAAKDFVLFLADGRRLQGRRGLHRRECQDLEQVSHHHVAKRPGRPVESGAFTEGQGLRYVDLHVIDEVAVPNRLKQPVGKTEGEDVLRRLLAKEVVDPEDPVLVKYLMQPGVQRYRTRQVGAERLFHDDPGPVDETGLAKHPHRRQGRARRHAHVMQATTFGWERLLRPVHCRFEDRGTSGERHIVQILDKGIPSETPMIRQPGINPAVDRWNSPGNSFRRARSPVAPTRTTTCG